MGALLPLAPTASAQLGFATAAKFGLGGGLRPSSAALGDLNGDGRLDIATANEDSGNASVMLGSHTGGFGPARSVSLEAAGSPQSVALAELNGDARLDLVTANSISHSVSLALGTATGAFGPVRGVSLGGAPSPHSVAVADVTGDARADLVIANRDRNDVSVRRALPRAPYLLQGAGHPSAIKAEQIRARLRRLSEAAGARRSDGSALVLRPHDCRRIFASEHLNNDTPPHVIQALLGHGAAGASGPRPPLKLSATWALSTPRRGEVRLWTRAIGHVAASWAAATVTVSAT